MIEKLPFTEIHTGGEDMVDIVESRPVPSYEMQHKINELVDAVNEIMTWRFETDEDSDWYDDPKYREQSAENVLTKSLRMDKEFTEDECVKLQGKLETTQKALEVALAALNTIKPKKDLSQDGYWTLSQGNILDVVLRAEKEIKHITKGSDNE